MKGTTKFGVVIAGGAGLAAYFNSPEIHDGLTKLLTSAAIGVGTDLCAMAGGRTAKFLSGKIVPAFNSDRDFVRKFGLFASLPGAYCAGAYGYGEIKDAITTLAKEKKIVQILNPGAESPVSMNGKAITIRLPDGQVFNSSPA